MQLDGLSPELLEKVKACKTAEELSELAEAEGIDLGDDMLEAISGGQGNVFEDFGSMGCLIP